jgi:hypothetical protein
VFLGAGSGANISKVLYLGWPPSILTILFCPAGSVGTRKLSHLASWPLHHQFVGGDTTCARRFWIKYWCYEGIAKTLKRQLSHLLDHSALPKVCSPEPSFRHLLPSAMLPMSGTLPPVVFPTHTTRTKWGSRNNNNNNTNRPTKNPTHYPTKARSSRPTRSLGPDSIAEDFD